MLASVQVQVILDYSFGRQLLDLPASDPVWIVASQVNTPVVQQLWHSAKKRPTEVTLLQPSAVLHFASLLATLHDHHGQSGSAPTYPQLSVYGLPPTPGVVEDLAEFGFRITQELPDNWIAVRLEDVLQP